MKKLLCGVAVIAAVFGMASPATAKSGPPPGATDPLVTQTDIGSTVCKSGYAKTVRNVSNATKSSIYAVYGIPQAKKRLYVIDHLIPLEVGGSNATANLWPELKADAKKKDAIENAVHGRLCSGQVTLAAAQATFTAVLPAPTVAPATAAPATAPPATAPPATEPPATEAPVPPAGDPSGGATALCNDGTYSYAANHQGACSRHGGVATFYK